MGEQLPSTSRFGNVSEITSAAFQRLGPSAIPRRAWSRATKKHRLRVVQVVETVSNDRSELRPCCSVPSASASSPRTCSDGHSIRQDAASVVGSAGEFCSRDSVLILETTGPQGWTQHHTIFGLFLLLWPGCMLCPYLLVGRDGPDCHFGYRWDDHQVGCH